MSVVAEIHKTRKLIHDISKQIAAKQESRSDVDVLLDGKRAQVERLRRKRDLLLGDRADAVQREIDLVVQRIDDLAKIKRRRFEQLEELQDRFKKARRHLRKLQHQREDAKINTTPGDPDWGGSDDIIRAECDPVAARYGAPVTSRKRSASDPLTVANPGSDHSALATLASAADYGTFNGAPLATAIAQALGISGYSVGNYNSYTIVRDGHSYRVQILWAVENHYNHVHVGIRRVS